MPHFEKGLPVRRRRQEGSLAAQTALGNGILSAFRDRSTSRSCQLFSEFGLLILLGYALVMRFTESWERRSMSLFSPICHPLSSG